MKKYTLLLFIVVAQGQSEILDGLGLELSNIKNFDVVIDSNADEFGITTSYLKNKAKLMLRKNGISYNGTGFGPYLYLNFLIMETIIGDRVVGHIISSKIELRRSAHYEIGIKTYSKTMASWDRPNRLSVTKPGKNKLKNSIVENLEIHIDAFSIALIEANEH